LKILYAKRKVTPQQIEGAKVILCQYFEQSTHKERMLEIFSERILLKRYQMDKRPEFFLPPPDVWMDPRNSWGFAWTNNLWKKVHKKRKENAEYYSNLDEFGHLLRQYFADPTIETFRIAEQRLGKFRDDKRLQRLFYSAVVAPEQINDLLQEYHYQGNIISNSQSKQKN
jgi:hypothetical protein